MNESKTNKSLDSLDRNSGEAFEILHVVMVLLVMEWVYCVRKSLGVPSYKDRVITEGSIFHIVTRQQWVLTLIMSDG
jgi:hypothetical protein